MEPPMLPRDLEPVVDLSDTGDGVDQVLCQPSGIPAVDCSRERHFAALDVQLDLAGVQIRTVGEQFPDFFVDLVIGATLELRASSGLRATRLSPLRSTAAISPRHPQLSFGGRDYYAGPAARKARGQALAPRVCSTTSKPWDSHSSGVDLMKATDIRRGHVIYFEGQPCRVMEFTHRTPGNLRAFVQARMRNLNSGATFEHRFSATEFVEEARL